MRRNRLLVSAILGLAAMTAPIYRVEPAAKHAGRRAEKDARATAKAEAKRKMKAEKRRR